jgi:hypothetical protein
MGNDPFFAWASMTTTQAWSSGRIIGLKLGLDIAGMTGQRVIIAQDISQLVTVRFNRYLLGYGANSQYGA